MLSGGIEEKSGAPSFRLNKKTSPDGRAWLKHMKHIQDVTISESFRATCSIHF